MKIVSSFLILSLLFCKIYAHAYFENGSAPWGADSELSVTQRVTVESQRACSSTRTCDETSTTLLGEIIPAYQGSQSRTPLVKEHVTLTAGQKSCRAMIRFFQVYISPIDGPRSSFYPTSSQYALEAIQKYGVLKGIAMGCDRLMRENGEYWVYKRTQDYGIERKLDPVR